MTDELDIIYELNENNLPDTPLQRELYNLGSCLEAAEWVGSKTLAEAWAQCEELAWLAWYAEEMGLIAREEWLDVDCDPYLYNLENFRKLFKVSESGVLERL